MRYPKMFYYRSVLSILISRENHTILGKQQVAKAGRGEAPLVNVLPQKTEIYYLNTKVFYTQEEF